MINSSNQISTNIFESNTGVLNIAPVKISGKYKIVVGSDNTLYLDDYTNRRVKIDKSQTFLPQVANFLSIKTNIVDIDKLKYGAFSESTTKSYHAPIYISSENLSLPKYFIISRVINDTITDSTSLQKFGDILKLIDLDQIGITAIFNEILELSNDRYEYPISLNWDDAKLDLFGYSLDTNSAVRKSISLLNSQANQPYLDVFDNMILNTFTKENIIFPKFINIEFEFDYVNNIKHFNNFFGHYSIGKNIDKTVFNPDFFTVTIQQYNNYIKYKQEKYLDQIDLSDYINILTTVSIVKLNEQDAQVRFFVNRISAEDEITIIHPDGEIYFQFIVSPDDIKSTLRETLKSICIRATDQSDRFLLFTENNGIITIKSNIEDEFIEEYKLVIARNFKLLDNNQDRFRAITVNDIRLGTESNIETLQTFNKLQIDNIFFNIVEIFFFEGKAILRLNATANNVVDNFAEVYVINKTKLIQLLPIPYFSVNSDLKAIVQYDIDGYITQLKESFGNGTGPLTPIFNAAVEEFSKQRSSFDLLPYVIENDKGELDVTNIVTYDKKSNEKGILNMMFNSPGETNYITPNILNIDKPFFEKNGNLSIDLGDSDPLRYHWFLIKGVTPNYTKGTINELRYFTDKPKLTSKLILNGDLYYGQTFVETIFLGVKYQLPQKYENYQFAVYLNYSDTKYANLKYIFDIDNEAKTIYLGINKYLDFIDLIRGGDIKNTPIIDLSFLYNIRQSFNTQSETISGFKTGGILLADTTIETFYQNTITKDWKIQDGLNWYICLKRSPDIITENFDDLFPDSGDVNFFVYSSIVYKGETYDYVSMIYTIKGIKFIKADFLWCENLEIKFFESKDMFIQKFKQEGADEIYEISKTNIVSSVPASNEMYGDDNIISTILVNGSQQVFRLINHDKIFSIKRDYFEVTRKVIYDSDSAIPKQIINSKFYFPEFIQPTWTYDDLVNYFAIDSFDNQTNSTIISLFDRNQIWRLIKDIMLVDVKFKFATEKQIRNLINELLVSQLREYSNLKSIPINLSDEFIKLTVVDTDVNLVIWKNENTNKVFKINRYRGPYLPYLRQLTNELEFQADILNNFQNSIYNIYDKDFGGLGVSATGIWNEVQGNIVSSLFCMDNNLVVSVDYGEVFDIRELIKTFINIDNATITNRNVNYISNIDNNIDSYIVNAYVDWMLLNVYTLSFVKNELNQTLKYTKNTKNNYLLNFAPIDTYQTRFNKLIFNFTRK